MILNRNIIFKIGFICTAGCSFIIQKNLYSETTSQAPGYEDFETFLQQRKKSGFISPQELEKKTKKNIETSLAKHKEYLAHIGKKVSPNEAFVTTGFFIVPEETETKSNKEVGAITTALEEIIQCQNACGIVHMQILKSALYWSKKNPLIQINKSIENLLNVAWKIYDISQPGSPFALLVPKKVLAQKQCRENVNNTIKAKTEDAFKLGLWRTRFPEITCDIIENKTVNEPLKVAEMFDNVHEIYRPALDILIRTIIPKLFVLQSQLPSKYIHKYLFYILAHGTASSVDAQGHTHAGIIAGFSRRQLTELFPFCDKKIYVPSIVFDTCFGSRNIREAMRHLPAGIYKNINLIAVPTMDTRSFGGGSDYESFFNIPMERSEQYCTLNMPLLINYLKPPSLQGLFYHFFLWKKPNTNWWESYNIKTDVVYIDDILAQRKKTVNIATFFAGRLQDNATSKEIHPELIVIKSRKINCSLVIPYVLQNVFKIISNRPGDIVHTFDRITAKKTSLEDFKSVFYIQELCAHKVFKINRLITKDFNGTFIYFSSPYDNRGIIVTKEAHTAAHATWDLFPKYASDPLNYKRPWTEQDLARVTKNTLETIKNSAEWILTTIRPDDPLSEYQKMLKEQNMLSAQRNDLIYKLAQLPKVDAEKVQRHCIVETMRTLQTRLNQVEWLVDDYKEKIEFSKDMIEIIDQAMSL